MNSRLNAVWIQIKESVCSMFPRTFRCGLSLLTTVTVGLVLFVAPNVYSQNSETPESKKNDNMKIKVVTDKDGKTEVMEFNGNDILANPEIAKTLKDLKIDISKIKKDLKGTTNISVKRVLKTDGTPSTSDEEVSIIHDGKGNKSECVVIVTGDSSNCTTKDKCVRKSTCIIETSDSKDGKPCKVICIKKNAKGDNSRTMEWTTQDNSMVTTEIETGNAHSSEMPKRVFIRKSNDDNEENITIIDAELTPNDDMMLSDGNHHQAMKFIIKQINEDGDSSKVRVIIRKYITDDVNTTEPNQTKTEEIPTSLDVTTLNLAPNPNKGQFTLSFSLKEAGNTSIIITDIIGKQVYSESLANFSGDYSKSLDLTTKARGEYLLKITQNGKSATANIVLE